MVTNQGIARTYEIEAFSPFFRDEAFIQANLTPEEIAAAQEEGYEFHVYLAHDWKVADINDKYHQVALEIKEELRTRDITPWDNETELRIYTAKAIMTARHHVRKTVVFLSYYYMKRVNDQASTTFKEFESALLYGMESVIVLVLQPGLMNPRNWFGAVVESKLQEATIIDFSTPERRNQNVERLIREIKK